MLNSQAFKYIFFNILFIGLIATSQIASAKSSISLAPGDYSLRFKIGPSFDINNYEDQVKLGVEFDYELGYKLGINMLILGGLANQARFQMIPSLRYDFAYIGPASFHALVGMGYGRIRKEHTLDYRLGLGTILPLNDRLHVNSDLNLFVSSLSNVKPASFEWLLGFGLFFK